jgi:hypothetical protein
MSSICITIAKYNEIKAFGRMTEGFLQTVDIPPKHWVQGKKGIHCRPKTARDLLARLYRQTYFPQKICADEISKLDL